MIKLFKRNKKQSLHFCDEKYQYAKYTADKKHKDFYDQGYIISKNISRPVRPITISPVFNDNNNIFVVGKSEKDKLDSFIIPNILKANKSYVVTDPDRKIFNATKEALKEKGYNIKLLDFTNPAFSIHYNPLHYIRISDEIKKERGITKEENDISEITNCLFLNSEPEENMDNMFFEDGQKLLLSACILYIVDYCHNKDSMDFKNVLKMLHAEEEDAIDEKLSNLDNIFLKLPNESKAFKYYKAFKMAAGKTLEETLVSLIKKLKTALMPNIINIMEEDNIGLDNIATEKTALFIVTPKEEKNYNFITASLYSQIYRILIDIAEQKTAFEDRWFDTPVMCIINGASNMVSIPYLHEIISKVYHYNVQTSIIADSLSQIKEAYNTKTYYQTTNEEWRHIISDCGTALLFAEQEEDTKEDLYKKLNQYINYENIKKHIKYTKHRTRNDRPIEVFMLPEEDIRNIQPDECVVFRHYAHIMVDKCYNFVLENL